MSKGKLSMDGVKIVLSRYFKVERSLHTISNVLLQRGVVCDVIKKSGLSTDQTEFEMGWVVAAQNRALTHLLSATRIAPPYALKNLFSRRHQPMARFRMKVRSFPIVTLDRTTPSPPEAYCAKLSTKEIFEPKIARAL